MPIEGNGIELTFDEVDTIALERRFEPFAFRGERRTWCRLLDGPVRDFNVMTARTAFAHSVTIHDVAEHSKIAVDRPRFAYVLRGGIAGAQAGDTLDVDPGDAISTHDALAGTILAVVTIAPVRFVPTKRRRR